MTKKRILVGHDSPTTAQFRRDLVAMNDAPAEGTVLWAQAKGDLPQGLNATPFRTGFSRMRWKREWFFHAIADLKAAKKVPSPLTDNFLRFDANPGDVDWFDDAGWQAIAQHFGIAAWIAKQGGLKGICFDAEPYTKPFVPFDYKALPEQSKHSFEAYLVKARQRGRETMRAICAEYPDLTVLTFFMASYLVESFYFHGPSVPQVGLDTKRGLFLHSYGLYMAFFDGWLDESAPKMRFVDGNENAYAYLRPERFFNIARKVKSEGSKLVSPENRSKFRAQVGVGSGIYLDAHARGLTKPEFELATLGPAMLRKNVAAALSAANEYVWLYGEAGRFWPDPKELAEWPGKEVFPAWETRIPGLTDSLRRAKSDRIAPTPPMPRPGPSPLPEAPAGAVNLLRNGDFAEGPPPDKQALPGASSDWGDAGAPAGWNWWQSENSKGRFDWDGERKAARSVGVREGCFLQALSVKPGERYLIRARVESAGVGLATLGVGFKTPEGKWLPASDRRNAIQPVGKDGAREVFALVARVPPDAGVLVVQLNAHGQPTEKDRLAWSGAEVFRVK